MSACKTTLKTAIGNIRNSKTPVRVGLRVRVTVRVRVFVRVRFRVLVR